MNSTREIPANDIDDRVTSGGVVSLWYGYGGHGASENAGGRRRSPAASRVSGGVENKLKVDRRRALAQQTGDVSAVVSAAVRNDKLPRRLYAGVA